MNQIPEHLSEAAEDFCRKHNITMDNISKCLEAASRAEQVEEFQLSYEYQSYCDYYQKRDPDKPLMTKEGFSELSFEFASGSFEEECAYGFLRLIRDEIQ